MTVAVLYVNTSEIRIGDVVLVHGMRVLIEKEPRNWPGGYSSTVYGVIGKVLNPEEVKEAKCVPYHWLFEEKFIPGVGWRYDYEGGARWYIQGNEWAQWAVERNEP
ncbi:hypothetical protein [Streptomyces sp. H27-H5]|uniref:hypothetical protein n=1 Tax=Streptomyces sp. H27-H5 TaxID=2996460 RepID=UPI00226F6610|nr:hypothetical protein [Streptomyces sp. H27-H5]MCY0955822.1 hypothetical protein [Streptomyces sp. H27-H5]